MLERARNLYESGGRQECGGALTKLGGMCRDPDFTFPSLVDQVFFANANGCLGWSVVCVRIPRALSVVGTEATDIEDLDIDQIPHDHNTPRNLPGIEVGAPFS